VTAVNDRTAQKAVSLRARCGAESSTGQIRLDNLLKWVRPDCVGLEERQGDSMFGRLTKGVYLVTNIHAVLGCMAMLFIFVTGCASTKAVEEPQAETATPLPVVEPASGPPPDYVTPTNYWVREKIILTSEQEPPVSATPKSSVKKGKKNKKTG
jgi:hypothetical protein